MNLKGIEPYKFRHNRGFAAGRASRAHVLKALGEMNRDIDATAIEGR